MFDDDYYDRREEFREQMNRCAGCGALCDGDVCDSQCAELADANYGADPDEETEEDQ